MTTGDPKIEEKQRIQFYGKSKHTLGNSRSTKGITLAGSKTNRGQTANDYFSDDDKKQIQSQDQPYEDNGETPKIDEQNYNEFDAYEMATGMQTERRMPNGGQPYNSKFIENLVKSPYKQELTCNIRKFAKPFRLEPVRKQIENDAFPDHDKINEERDGSILEATQEQILTALEEASRQVELKQDKQLQNSSDQPE